MGVCVFIGMTTLNLTCPPSAIGPKDAPTINAWAVAQSDRLLCAVMGTCMSVKRFDQSGGCQLRLTRHTQFMSVTSPADNKWQCREHNARDEKKIDVGYEIG
jgi:hypothetical protein